MNTQEEAGGSKPKSRLAGFALYFLIPLVMGLIAWFAGRLGQ